MSYPESTVHDIPVVVQAEFLTLLDGCPVTPAMRDVLAEFRGDVSACAMQPAMFVEVRES